MGSFVVGKLGDNCFNGSNFFGNFNVISAGLMVGGRVRVGVIMDHPAPHFTILVWWGESNVVAVRLLMERPLAPSPSMG